MRTALSGKRIIITGGGTGGHITPLVQVAARLRKDNDLLWIADETPLARRSAESLGIPYISVPTAKFHRFFTLENLQVPWRVFQGVTAAKQAIRSFRPDIVLAKGGYASLPVVIAAADLHIPVVIHESDIVMGWANRMAAHYAQRICTNFPTDQYPALPHGKLVQTGLPIAPDFFATTHKPALRRPRLLVTGGSQGAHAINLAIRQALPQLLTDWDVDHIVGDRDFGEFTALAQDGYRVYSFIDQKRFARLIANSRVVIGRASATTYSEVAAVGRPMIVVPLPTGANRHQYRNAEVWQQAGAALVIDQKDLQPAQILRALQDAQTKVSIPAMRKFVRRDAADLVINVIKGAL